MIDANAEQRKRIIDMFGWDNLYTNKQEEKYYCVPGSEDGMFPEDKLQYALKSFFEELISRARGTKEKYNSGLQANIVITEDGTVILKIAEKDGTEHHQMNIDNMIRYYYGEEYYYTELGYNKSSALKESRERGGGPLVCSFRILDQSDELMITGFSERGANPFLDDYKKKIVKMIADEVKRIHDDKCYDSVRFGFISKGDNISLECNEFNDINYQDFISLLNINKKNNLIK